MTVGPVIIRPGASLILEDATSLSFYSGMTIYGEINASEDVVIQSLGIGENIVLSQDLGIDGAMFLGAGKILEFNGGTLLVGDLGNPSLPRAEGTFDNPIIFRSVTPSGSTDWSGIEIQGSQTYDLISDTGTAFYNVEVRNATNPFFITNNQAIGIFDSSIHDSNTGVRINSTNASHLEFLEFENISISPIIVTLDSEYTLSGGMSFINTRQAIGLFEGAYIDQGTLEVQNWPRTSDQITYIVEKTLIIGGITYYIEARNFSAWRNFGSDDNLFDFKVTRPVQLIIQMPGQTFTNGIGITGTPEPVLLRETTQTANVYAVDEENFLIPTYSGNMTLFSDDENAEFLAQQNSDFTNGTLPFQVIFSKENPNGWVVQATQNTGNWTVTDGESAPVPVLTEELEEVSPTTTPTSTPTPSLTNTPSPTTSITPTTVPTVPSITLRVVDENGNLIPGVRISIIDQVINYITDENGEVSINNIPIGELDIIL